MSHNIPVTRSNPFDAVLKIKESKQLLGRNAHMSCHKSVEPFTDDAASMEAWTAAFEKLERQDQVSASMNQPETIGTSRFINVGKAALWDIIINEVKRQIANRFHDSITTAVEETVMDTI